MIGPRAAVKNTVIRGVYLPLNYEISFDLNLMASSPNNAPVFSINNGTINFIAVTVSGMVPSVTVCLPTCHTTSFGADLPLREWAKLKVVFYGSFMHTFFGSSYFSYSRGTTRGFGDAMLWLSDNSATAAPASIRNFRISVGTSSDTSILSPTLEKYLQIAPGSFI